MSSNYLDTSFLVSLYVADAHSSKAIHVLRQVTGALLITPLAETELCNAIELRLFRKEITLQQAATAARTFEQDVQAGVFGLRPVPSVAFEKARRLARQHTAKLGTRTLDLLHVAAALTLGADTLLSFDLSQRKLARAEGMALHSSTV